MRRITEDEIYSAIRAMLIGAVVLAIYSVVAVLLLVPYAWLAAIVLGIWHLRKKAAPLTSHGSARWADAADLKGMLDE